MLAILLGADFLTAYSAGAAVVVEFLGVGVSLVLLVLTLGRLGRAQADRPTGRQAVSQP